MRAPSIRALAAGLAVVLAAGLTGCGSSQSALTPAAHRNAAASVSRSAPAPAARRNGAATRSALAPVAHPQAIEPVAGAAAAAPAAPSDAGAAVTVGPAAAGGSLPQPQSLSEVRQALAQSGMSASTTQATLTSGGLAIAPIGAPPAVQAIIAAGNEIAHLPYVWGGGHATYEDTGYDCSGSISYVFAAAGLLDHTVTSGELENWGAPGPGRWITVYANAGHTFMYVAGLRFDTVALAETGSRWSNRPADESNLSTFSVRHPPGL